MRRLAPLALLLLGCSSSSDLLTSRRGQRVTVQVRTDMLGMANDIPAPVSTDSLNGATITVSGKLVASDDRWVTVEQDDGSETMVAQGTVLRVTVFPNPR